MTRREQQLARWHGMWRAALAEAGPRVERDRDMVLKHPDLAQKLTEEPLSYKSPGQWSGYIPPDLWGESRNNSPERAALVAVWAEAAARERGGAA